MDPFEYLESRGHFNIVPGLERMERIMGKFKDPHLSIPAVHIGGTNGKGSTSAMVESILGSFPIRTGTYTSPHLQRITERLRIDGEEIDRDDLGRTMSKILDQKGSDSFEGGLTYFELITAASFLGMVELGVNVNISEVGMGGRWDATNVLEPQAIAITSISMDHMDHLGDDPVSITSEKCGIIKPSTPVVVGEVCSLLEERERCLRTILDACTHNGCPVVLISDESGVKMKEKLLSSYNIPDWRIISVKVRTDKNGISVKFLVHKPHDERQTEPKFRLIDEVMEGTFETSVIGRHQGYNLGIAISLSMLVLPFAMAHSKLRGGNVAELSNLITGSVDSVLEAYSYDTITRMIRSGLSKLELRGRMEMMNIGDRRIFVDGGHNIEAARMISDTVRELENGTGVHLLFTMMGDKESGECLHELDLKFNTIVFASLPYKRSMSTGKLLEGMIRAGSKCSEIHVRDDIDDAIDVWLSRIGENEIGLAVGSFYLYSFIKERLDDQKV